MWHLSKQELIERVEELEEEVGDLESEVEAKNDEIEGLIEDVVSLEQRESELESEIEELKYPLDVLKGNLRDELKYDFLLENYDKITIDDLEDIVSKKRTPLKIQFKDWDWECGEPSCCYECGEEIYLNGESLYEIHAEDSQKALRAVLKKLGYKVEISYIYEKED